MNKKERYAFGYISPELIFGKPEDNKYVSSNKTFVPKYSFLYDTIIAVICIFGVIFTFIELCNHFAPSEEQIAEMQKMQVIQEFDGCKIYRFYDGNYHYVTRCGSKVTTQKSWDEYCGRACTRHRKEELTTENNE